MALRGVIILVPSSVIEDGITLSTALHCIDAENLNL